MCFQRLDRPRVHVPTLEQGVDIAKMVVRGSCDDEAPTARRNSAAAVYVRSIRRKTSVCCRFRCREGNVWDIAVAHVRSRWEFALLRGWSYWTSPAPSRHATRSTHSPRGREFVGLTHPPPPVIGDRTREGQVHHGTLPEKLHLLRVGPVQGRQRSLEPHDHSGPVVARRGSLTIGVKLLWRPCH